MNWIDSFDRDRVVFQWSTYYYYCRYCLLLLLLSLYYCCCCIYASEHYCWSMALFKLAFFYIENTNRHERKKTHLVLNSFGWTQKLTNKLCKIYSHLTRDREAQPRKKNNRELKWITHLMFVCVCVCMWVCVFVFFCVCMQSFFCRGYEPSFDGTFPI